MNNLIKITNIVVYIFFAQVYPIAHWHPDDHHDNLGLHMSEPTQDLPLHDHHHDDHPGHTDELEHGECYFVGSQDYTFAVKIFTSKLTTQFPSSINFAVSDSQNQKRKLEEVPPKLAIHYLPVILPNRAPPVS